MPTASSAISSGQPARIPGFIQGIMLLLPITLAVMGISVLGPIVPLLLQHFKDVPHAEPLVLLGILTMPAFWILAMSLPAGWVSDRVGRRKLLIWSMVAYGIVGVAPTMLDNIYAIIFTRMLVGACEAFLMTVSTCMIGDYFAGRARERWMAGQTAVASVAAIPIGFFGGHMADALGWRGPFYLYAYALVLAVFVAIFIWEPQSRPAAVSTGEVPADQEYVEFPWARIVSICLLTLLASICFYTVITKSADALNAVGVTQSGQIGNYMTASSFGVVLGTFLYWGIGRLPIHYLLFIDFMLLGVGFVFMGQAHTPGVFAFWSFINQIGCGLVLPTMLVWATRGLAFQIRGRGTGLWQAAFVAGQFLSAYAVTELSKSFGGLLPTLGLMGKVALAFAVIAVIAGFVWPKSSSAMVQTT